MYSATMALNGQCMPLYAYKLAYVRDLHWGILLTYTDGSIQRIVNRAILIYSGRKGAENRVKLQMEPGGGGGQIKYFPRVGGSQVMPLLWAK